jgi:branched-chain amino acid transport system permease protein
MRAASDNPRAAMLCGIDIRAMSLVAFAIAASTGALAGAFVAPISSAYYESGLFLGLKGFAAAMLGGLGNPIGAVLGGMLIGLIETGSAGYVTSVFKDAIALGLLILVLIVKPDGLLGRAEAKRV